MAKQYKIRRGDILSKIAKRFYGDYKLYKKLALYNGIYNPNQIKVGETIEIPSRQELEGKPKARPKKKDSKPPAKAKPGAPPPLVTPHGLEEVIATFGDIRKYIRSDGTLMPNWERKHLARTRLPFSIPLSWARSSRVSRLYCHKKLVKVFPAVFAEIQRKGLRSEIRTYGGCFNYRSKRSSGKLSTHSWGISIDLNPTSNGMGTKGDMNPKVVEIFRRHGFKWGGDWTGRGKDPMHFQFCTGY